MSLYVKRDVPYELFDVRLLEANDAMLLQASRELGIGLNPKEMKAVQSYFKTHGRNPTDVEVQTIGQTWSEHCYHKTFKGEIQSNQGKIDNLFKTYITKATSELKLPWCISVFEDNAGIIGFENGCAIAAKVETHNHPSAIEPFGGAATGIGGVIRDVLGVWADPIACTDVLGFGPLTYEHDNLPAGTKHPKYLFQGVVAGIGHYGNNMGIPTVNGAIRFQESYVGNIVVYCGCIGILPVDKFVRDTQPGDVALLVGGRTGRDGIHGVTFASAELTQESEEVSRPAVQIANPIEEEKMKRAILETRDEGLGTGITDLGGGGISCATGEMAYRSNCGISLELDRVPLKYPGMAPWEIHISESQERMLLSVPEKNLMKVLAIFESEEVEATPIGKFTRDGIFHVTFLGQSVAELDLRFMFQPPQVKRTAEWTLPTLAEPNFLEPTDLTSPLLQLLASPNIASKETVIRTYDHEVKGNTVLKPLQSRYGGPNDAAVIKPLNNSWKGIVISSGINPNYGRIDPYWMTASCIDEAIRNNTSVGGRRIALLDNFTWGNPEKPDRLGSLVRSCQACYDFARQFQTPFISGKDSLYNESPLGPITPTILITAIGVIPDVRNLVSMDLKRPGNPLYMVGQTYSEMGGSEYYRLKGMTGKTVPQVRGVQAKKIMDSMIKAIDVGCVSSCHDLSEGGLAVATAEMAFSGGFGIDLHLKMVPRTARALRNDTILFSETNSRFLVEVSSKLAEEFESLMKGNIYARVGRVKKDQCVSIFGLNKDRLIDIELAQLRNRWQSALEE